MQYLNIADYILKIDIEPNEIFSDRTRKYCVLPKDADLSISYEQKNKLEAPKGKLIAKDGERSFLISDDGCFCIFDSILGTDTVIALIKASPDFSEVASYLVDVESLGGANIHVRSFNMIGEIFKYFTILHGDYPFHSSALSCRGQGILFTAPSGTGKSTHTNLWKEHFEDVVVINDDLPIVKFKDECAHIYGTPWSGKTTINENISAPLKSIIFLEQAKDNSIERIKPIDAVLLMYKEAVRPIFPSQAEKTLSMIEKIVKTVPMYKLKCNISKEAALLSKSTL